MQSVVFQKKSFEKKIGDPTTQNFNSATFYSYDIAGNIDTLVQDFGIGSNNIMNIHTTHTGAGV